MVVSTKTIFLVNSVTHGPMHPSILIQLAYQAHLITSRKQNLERLIIELLGPPLLALGSINVETQGLKVHFEAEILQGSWIRN